MLLLTVLFTALVSTYSSNIVLVWSTYITDKLTKTEFCESTIVLYIYSKRKQYRYLYWCVYRALFTNSIKIYGLLEDQTTLNPAQHFYHLLTYIYIFIVYSYTKYKLFACPFNISQFRKRHMYSAASTYSVWEYPEFHATKQQIHVRLSIPIVKTI